MKHEAIGNGFRCSGVLVGIEKVEEGKTVAIKFEPATIERNCAAAVDFGGDYDDGYSFYCDLPSNHRGSHVEKGTDANGKSYQITWEE